MKIDYGNRWQGFVKMAAHRRAEKINSYMGWRGATPEIIDKRYTGNVVIRPHMADELGERALYPQPPPLTAENIRTLLRDADERFLRELEHRCPNES